MFWFHKRPPVVKQSDYSPPLFSSLDLLRKIEQRLFVAVLKGARK